jgi:ubiquinone/menaquinone biosynthesis C-methylase UbiE
MDYFDAIESQVFLKIATYVKDTHRILELGCGDGRLGNYLARLLGCEVLGIDINPEAFSHGLKKSRELKIDHLVEYVQWNGEQLAELRRGTFDACVSLYVLHELKHPLIVLRQVRRILNKNGIMVNGDFPKNSIAEELYDEEYYDCAYMKSMLAKACFRRIKVDFTRCRQLAFVSGLR